MRHIAEIYEIVSERLKTVSFWCIIIEGADDLRTYG